MAVDNTNVELRKDDLVADTPVPVDIDVFDESTIKVYYGNARALAVVGDDYTITLDNAAAAPEDKIWPTGFSITPLAALIAKIDALIIADATEENVAFVRRQLGYTSDFAETDGFLRARIAREFDRTIMRMQQLAYDFALITGLATAKVDAEAAASQAATSATTADGWATRAMQWAETVGGLVAATGYSAKEWAIGTFTRGSANGGSAKDWAVHTGGTVDDAEYSAKHYAVVAANYAATINPASFATAAQGAKADTAVQPGSLGPTATSNDYNDLDNKPAAVVAATTLLAQYQKASGTAGDAMTVSAWNDIPFNTMLANDIAGSSLATPNFTLPAGTYEVHAATDVAYGSSNFSRLRLYNTTDATVALQGVNDAQFAATGKATAILGRFTLAAAKDIKLQAYVGGGGSAPQALTTGDAEVYAAIMLRKVG